MATPHRFFENRSYYHVYNRGNKRDQIFLNNREYERFLGKMIEYKKLYRVNIVAYCLMPNHFHFLLQQLESNSITKFMSNLCNSHSRYFNVKYQSVGSLFQGRFKAKKVEKDIYLIHLSRYIHLNPVDLFGLPNKIFVNEILNYKWSSLPSYLSGSKNEIVDPQFILSYFSKKDPAKDYKNFVVSNIKSQEDGFIDHLML